jgi:two-component system, chemotaxis family, chemotaxis protein CheY
MNKSVFIIDDSNFARRVNRTIFSEIGYKVLGEASDYSSAIDGLKSLKESPEIITLDIIMPEKTGDQLLPGILELHPDSKIIMLTSIADSKTVKDCIQNGAKGYIVKPVNKAKIEDALFIIETKESLKLK